MGDSNHRSKRRIVVLIAAFLAISAGSYLVMEFATAWPPPSAERRTQRQKVAERIQASGGWEALRRDALSLMEQHGENFYEWDKHDTNGLPASIAALKPMEVEYYPTKFLSEMKDGRFTDPPNVRVVRIRVFGMPSTGGHPTPYFGLEVVSGTGTKDYTPRPQEATSGNRHVNYSRVTEGIYEIY